MFSNCQNLSAYGDPCENTPTLWFNEKLLCHCCYETYRLNIKDPTVESLREAISYIKAKNQAKDFLEELYNSPLKPEEILEKYKKAMAAMDRAYADNPALQAVLELEIATKIKK